MKGLLFFGAFALLAFVSCKDIDVPYVPEDTPDGTYDDAWYADNATISSSDTHFAVTEEGEGTISFKAEGGSVVVYVDCGTEWTADDSGAGVFGCDVQETCITVTAEQNLVEEELYGTITFMTSESKIQFATISITQNAYGAPEIKVSTNEWHVPAVAATAEELTTEIGVEANEEWSVECNADWLTAEKGENSVILTAAENETFEERVAEVVLTCTDGINSDSETITVTQDARAYITLGAAELQFARTGGEATITVDANYDWGCEYESDWFTVVADTNAGTITVTCDVNGTGKAREGTVTFTAGDGAANTALATFTITQESFDPASLVLEYTFDIDGVAIGLPFDNRDSEGNYTIDCTVDWGDGETESVSSEYPYHTYSERGTYIVIINGTVEKLYSNDDVDDGKRCLTAVKQWGNTGLRSMSHAFFECSNLTSLPDGPGPFENVTTFKDAFGDCTSLKEVPEDLFKNCGKCIYFTSVFQRCTSLASAPSFEGLSNATDFNNAFRNCASLTTVPEDMFSGCTAVTNFSCCFFDCSSVVGESPYEEILVEGETVKVHLYERENYPDYFTTPTSYSQCFYGCTKLDDYDDIPSGWK